MPAERRGEFERIRAIVAGLPPGDGVVLGPGDDAAVLRPSAGCDLVVTTDAFVEGVHWREGLLPPEGVGRRLAAANLSDIAAMGARPRWAVIACGASAAASEPALRAIEHACAVALAAEGAAVVGGNLAGTSGPAWFVVTLIGEVECGAAFVRSGARCGDALAVTGSPGRAAATLGIALAARPASLAGVPAELAAWYAAPPCRVRAARALAAAGGVRAAIDISDGLAADLAHLCDASDVGVEVETAAFPDDAGLLAAAARIAVAAAGESPAALAARLRVMPGDDYELLLAIAPERFEACRAAALAAGTPLTRIGAFTPAAAGRSWRQSDGTLAPLPSLGFDHFG